MTASAVTAPGGTGRWTAAEPVVLRRAGFPFAWLDELAWPAAAQAAGWLMAARGDEVPFAREAFAKEYELGCAGPGAAVLRRYRDKPGLRGMLLVSNDAAFHRLVRWLADVADPG